MAPRGPARGRAGQGRGRMTRPGSRERGAEGTHSAPELAGEERKMMEEEEEGGGPGAAPHSFRPQVPGPAGTDGLGPLAGTGLAGVKGPPPHCEETTSENVGSGGGRLPPEPGDPDAVVASSSGGRTGALSKARGRNA
nr:uncharacterized protein LOC111751439 [Loxodonta africana]